VRALLGGRLPPEEMFPAGRAGYDVRWLTLPSGLRVRTVRCDPEEPSASSPVVVFVHGWACSLFTWHRNLRAVADAGMRVHAFDLVGHGRSDKPLDERHYTVPAMAQQLREVLDGLGLERVLLVGHSMGCAIALRAAIDTPERVAGLVLAAPVGFGAVSDMRYLRWLSPRPVEVIAPYCVPRWTFRVALWRAYGRIGHASPRDIDEYWAPTQDPAFVRVLCRLSHTFEWTDGDPDELARVRCPTTVLFGEHDHLVRSDACRPFVDCLPHVRWAVVPGAGHTLPEEVPDRVNAAVVEAARPRPVRDAVASSVAMG
jgi:pimeloyl-ACP methyl ester carboxylesterase